MSKHESWAIHILIIAVISTCRMLKRIKPTVTRTSSKAKTPIRMHCTEAPMLCRFQPTETMEQSGTWAWSSHILLSMLNTPTPCYSGVSCWCMHMFYIINSLYDTCISVGHKGGKTNDSGASLSTPAVVWSPQAKSEAYSKSEAYRCCSCYYSQCPSTNWVKLRNLKIENIIYLIFTPF